MTPQPAQALPVGAQLGPYRIVRLLGEGGMGAVYEARQEPLDRRVALKTLHPEYARDKESVARFFNEAKVLSRLEHPSIVQVSDFGQSADGTAYLVMEFLRGDSLARRLRSLFGRGERLPVVTALQLGWQVADTLAIAHAQGIVHRDLKPENLMLVADSVAPGGERVKILDFGIAKLTDASDRGGVKTDTQAVMGTPLYMSPEQCAGAGGVDAKTDVYSLGCVLYEALAGRPPFLADGPGQLIGMHLFQEPQPLSKHAPKVPSAVVELVHRFLTKDKSKRPSMSDAADDIGRILSKMSGSGPIVRSRPPATTDPEATRHFGPTPPSTTLGQSIGQRTAARRRLQYLTLALGGGVLLTFTVVLLRRGEPAQPLIQTDASAAAAAASVVTPPAPKKVLWRIESSPAGASVLDEEGQTLGATPWLSERPTAEGTTRLRVRKEGYVDATVTLDRGRDVVQQLALSKRSAPSKKSESTKAVSPPARPAAPEKPQPTASKRVRYED